MSQHISPDNYLLEWTGIISLESKESEVRPWRLPFEQKHLFHDELIKWARMAAGVTINFSSNTSKLKVGGAYSLSSLPGEDSGAWELWKIKDITLDLYCDGTYVDSKPALSDNLIEFDGLGSDIKNFQLWLPHMGEFGFKGFEIDQGSILKKSDSGPKPVWVAYGDSGTQGVGSEHPHSAWPATIAIAKGYELVSMSYGGNCHLDTMVARVIRDRPADLISLSLGANIQIQSSLNRRTFASSVIGFIEIIREKHQDTPLVIMSPFYCEERERIPNLVGFTMPDIRDEIEKVFKALSENGDNNLYYVNGLDLLNVEHRNLFPDGKHPNSNGYATISQNIEPFLSKAFQRVAIN